MIGELSMATWVVTTGSSDVQLRSDEDWNRWNREVKPKCGRLTFVPTQSVQEDGPYRIPPRMMGLVYEEFSEEVWKTLVFPLLDVFRDRLKDENLDQIVLLLTDQSAIFPEDERTETDALLQCPYWQDTIELLPILTHYFDLNFPGIPLIPVVLDPQGKEGLDDWNAVLELVREKLRSLSVPTTKVYVSHQAGTPAISSAVQFCSLARFRTDVEFLVSSEYRPTETRLISRSSYLRGIQRQEAIAMLKNHDYSAIQKLMAPDLLQAELGKPIKQLLEVAVQWNLAEFEKVKKLVLRYELATPEDFPWHWMGYEGAYLAIVRLEQRNVVEALFHSFRSAEGLISKWAEHFYRSHIVYNSGSPQIKSTIQEVLPSYWTNMKGKNKQWLEDKRNIYDSVGLHSNNLYQLFKEAHSHVIISDDVNVIWKSAKLERNQQFHRLLGLKEEDLFQAWNVADRASWEKRLCFCLNGISGETISTVAERSLMAKVHKKLVDSIDSL
jgi:hypothetical protein